jgi:hypothetical protein
MVDDDIVRPGVDTDVHLSPSGRSGRRPASDSDVTENNVVHSADQVEDLPRIVSTWSPPDQDAAARGGLTRHSQVRVAHTYWLSELNRSRNPKDHDSWTGRLKGRPQASRSAVVQIRHFDDSSTAAAGSAGTRTLRLWEGRISGQGKIQAEQRDQ